MSIERELARVRAKTNAEEINRRHRRAQEAAERARANMTAPSNPSGVSTEFQNQLQAARKRAQQAAKRDPREAADERLAQLRASGQLPPAVPENVGYEPTAEEVLGELGAAPGPVTDPELTESVPTADEVLDSEREGPIQEAAGVTEPLTHQQLNPALRGALERAALETAKRPANNHSKRSKHRR